MRTRARTALPLAALLLAAFLALPGALAGAAHETRGRLHLDGAATARGEVHLYGQGLLEVDAPTGDLPLQVGFGRLVDGQLVHRTRDKVHLGLPGNEGVSVSEPEATITPLAAAGGGRVENVRCGPRCLVALHDVDGAGQVGAEGLLDGALAPAPSARDVHTSTPGQNAESQFRYVVPAGALEAAGATPALRPWASGRVALVLADATFDLVDADGRRTVDVRSGNETTREAAGHPLTVRHHARHVLLVLEDPALVLGPGAAFRLGFPEGADLRLEGAFSVLGALGDVTIAGTPHVLDHDAVLLQGAMDALLRPAGSRASGERPLHAEISGHVTRVAIRGVDVTPVPPAPPPAAMGAGALAVLAAALLARPVLLPLYHRLGPMDVLANENRRRIYETIRARPGVSVGELVDAVGLARILVRHHLKMLEAHKLVRATSWRRRRTYAVAGEDAGPAACELKDPTRRRVAAALVQAGKATQKDLVDTLGLSQRLVSYHLTRLEAASLLAADGKHPRAYAATEALARAVEREEAAAAGTAAGDRVS